MSFVQRLKDPAFVIRGCHLVWKTSSHEITSAAFDHIWRDFLRDGHNKPDWHTRLGIAYLMTLEWNKPFFINNPDQLWKFRNDIEDAFEQTRRKLETLEGLYLGSASFDLYADLVKGVYETWSLKPSIRMTGASKLLHFLIPWLFMPWDDAIRRYYHEECKHTGHQIGDADCYLEFMRTCNDIAAALLEKCRCKNYRQLAYLHPAYAARGDIRTIPKMLDECNYAWITKGLRW